MGGYPPSTATFDIETCDLNSTDPTTVVLDENRRYSVIERYGNMNRKERRVAMAKERRALRKWK